LKAQTLRQLFEIREDNRTLLDSIGPMGTALGRKNGDGDPSVLVYVDQKIGKPWLPPGRLVPDRLTGKDGRFCPTDVISGNSDRDVQLRVFNRWEVDQGLRPLGELVSTIPLTPERLKLRDRLRGNTDVLTPGCQLTFQDEEGAILSGTLACFARDKQDKRLGLLTNQHIGKTPGNVLSFPDIGHRQVAVFARGILDEPVSDRFGRGPDKRLDPWQNRLRIDAGFCELVPGLDPDRETNPRLPVIENCKIQDRELGPPVPLRLDSMDPIGASVLGVGRTRSFQQGTIEAFSFEFLDASRGVREYNDYLIIGKDDTAFSDPGDSGKLIVLEEGLRPIAMMWGGDWSRRRRGRELENWTNATDINLILDRLDVDLVTA